MIVLYFTGILLKCDRSLTQGVSINHRKIGVLCICIVNIAQFIYCPVISCLFMTSTLWHAMSLLVVTSDFQIYVVTLLFRFLNKSIVILVYFLCVILKKKSSFWCFMFGILQSQQFPLLISPCRLFSLLE